MTSIERLCVVAPPPEHPKGPGNELEWRRLEMEIGLVYPSDFKELIFKYGSGRFKNFFAVVNPFHFASPDISYKAFVRFRLDGLRKAKHSYFKNAVPYPVYPDEGGLFPWGYTDNGGSICWLTKGQPSRWPTICLDRGYSKEFDEFEMSIVEFIEKWLTDQILTPTLTPPDFYPLRQPVFSSL
jgi:hypothetical protein